MNVNWLIVLAATVGVLLAATALTGLATWRTRRELKRERERSLGEANEIRSAVTALQTQIAEMTQSAAHPEPSQQPFVPAPTLTADQRAEALGMLRSGMGSHAVCTTLRLSQAETALLQKVQSFLDSPSSVQ